LSPSSARNPALPAAVQRSLKTATASSATAPEPSELFKPLSDLPYRGSAPYSRAHPPASTSLPSVVRTRLQLPSCYRRSLHRRLVPPFAALRVVLRPNSVACAVAGFIPHQRFYTDAADGRTRGNQDKQC
jgi:hypothetical protein